NQLIVESRQEVFATVLTDCARSGIFRYYNGFINGNAAQPSTTIGGVPQQAVVNPDGSPKSPDGTALQYLSVFGNLGLAPGQNLKNDCSDAPINASTLVPNAATSSWDPNRTHLDKTGFI